LLFVSHDALFFATVLGFLASAGLVLSIILPAPTDLDDSSFLTRATKGVRIYLATPRLRGLLALNLAAAAGGAMVLVNTVILVKDILALDDSALAISMAAFGAGSMVAALGLPKLLDTGNRDRPVMIGGAILLVATMIVLFGVTAVSTISWSLLLVGWAIAGLGYSAVLTPSGRLLRRSVHAPDRPAIFAAQFALSHACWLVTYPLAGWLMTVFGAGPAFLVLGLVGSAGIYFAQRLWPGHDPQEVLHSHDNLAEDHPHLDGSRAHAHDFRIDTLHPRWPSVRS
jgi:predicted MFS family arabinose efflux permease